MLAPNTSDGDGISAEHGTGPVRHRDPGRQPRSIRQFSAAGRLGQSANGAPTVAPLAVLVDHAAGLVNHYRRASDEWTVSSELSLEITPAALTVVADTPEVPAVATARPVGTRGPTALGRCEITLGER